MTNLAPKPEIGDFMKVWWFTGTCPPNMARVLAVRPYVGRYTRWFRFVVQLSAPKCESGFLEMTVE